MTSRPPLGVVPQRQAQRTLSGTGLSQRPATHQRSLSSQFLPSSPIRRETFPDFNPFSTETTDAGQGKYGSLRRGGSRLKVELSSESITHDDITESPNAIDSSKPFTPSRMMPLTDHSDLGDMSPHTSTHAQTLDVIDSRSMPLPKRRQRFTTQPIFRQTATAPAPPPKKDARPKPYSLETPSVALQYRVLGKGDAHSRSAAGGSSGGAQVTVAYADFVPWTGSHLEDQFSEHVIRNGFFDKQPVGQTETASAKTAIFPALKLKTGGVNTLSQILAGVLAHRKLGGQIKSASTFKPPPRVTLTDTKREIWLKDLANPAISLRRLSRTIPHGIRGKILLDHCLNKNVPTDRAVWLAKCVGANEIRAFKRKGVNGAFVMGGETKWIRDWTVSVEQFVESVMLGFGDADWKGKVNYVIRLATHLYAEYLLDREQYMEWLVTGLETSTHAKLPMWILITQMHWNDLLASRKMGRRLVAALLSHQQVIQTNPDKDLLQPLTAHLSMLLSSLLRSSPSNLIHPSLWAKYGHVFASASSIHDTAIQTTLTVLGARNNELLGSNAKLQPALQHVLVGHLDTTLYSVVADDLPSLCWNLSHDKASLGRILLEWCTCIYRPGRIKVYVTARVLRVWSTERFDSTAAILDFLDIVNLDGEERTAPIYTLVTELVRSGHFSIPRYFQWIIARGGLSWPGEVDADGPCGSRLLVELPIDALSESQRNVRAGMLRRVTYPVDEQTQDAEAATRLLKSTLESTAHLANPVLGGSKLLKRLSKRISRSSHALKTQIGFWIRHNLGVDRNGSTTDSIHGYDVPASLYTSVRAVLEACEDFRMLGEVVALATQASNVDVLASCADTVNRHLLIFSAIGVAQDLFHGLLARLKSAVEVQGLRARPLLASLAALAPRFLGLEELATQLNRDLAKSDRNTGIDACSPVSDNMTTRLQEEGGDLHEGIEKLLASGTSLDWNTMDRLFGTIVSRLQNSWDKATEQARAFCALLTRLRVFDPKHFDSLMISWIRGMRTSQTTPTVLPLFPVLVSSGCLSLYTIIAAATMSEAASAGAGPKPFPQPTAAPPAATAFLHTSLPASHGTRFLQGVLLLMLKSFTPDELLDAEECYRIATLQQQACMDHSTELLTLVRVALAEYAICRSQGDAWSLPLDDPVCQEALVRLLQMLVLKDTSAVVKTLATKILCQDVTVGRFVDRIVTKMLVSTADASTQLSFDQILQLTDEFTLPFCQLKLSLSLMAGEPGTPDTNTTGGSQSALELFIRATDHAVNAKNVGWAGLLSCLSPEITHHIKNRAQSRLLGLMPSARTEIVADNSNTEQSIQRAEHLISVIETIVRGNATPQGRPPQLVPAMVDKLADLWELLASSPSPATTAINGDVTSVFASTKSCILNHWLPLLVTLVTLHLQNPDTSRAANEVRARAVLVLCGLMQEMDVVAVVPGEPALGVTPPRHPLAERIFAVLCVLVDHLSEDARLLCVRAVRDCSADPRLRYLLSFAGAGAEERLMLAKKERLVLGAGRGAAAAGAGSGALATPTPTPTGDAAPASGTAALGRLHPLAEKLMPFTFRRWEILNEPTPNVGENDTSINLVLFEARKIR